MQKAKALRVLLLHASTEMETTPTHCLPQVHGFLWASAHATVTDSALTRPPTLRDSGTHNILILCMPPGDVTKRWRRMKFQVAVRVPKDIKAFTIVHANWPPTYPPSPLEQGKTTGVVKPVVLRNRWDGSFMGWWNLNELPLLLASMPRLLGTRPL